MLQVRSLLSSSGFDFDWPDGARVLSGTKEGLWGWLAINYATGALQVSSVQETTCRLCGIIYAA